MLSAYFGGYLIDLLGSNRKVFLVSSLLPAITFIAGLVVYENTDDVSKRNKTLNTWSTTRYNLAKVSKFLRRPVVFKPVIFIFLVVVAPGTSDALFFYRSDVLKMSSQALADINVCMSIATITGVWTYTLLLKTVRFKTLMVWVTVLLALVQGSNILLAQGRTRAVLLTPEQFTFIN